jgi:AmmeMemoRadiSam system protein A
MDAIAGADLKGRVLIAIAREAIAAAGDYRAREGWDEPWLREHGASFVTLRKYGDLCGCIGTIEAHRPLGEDVAHNAYAAAYRDHRFAPLGITERALVDVEVSVLSPRTPVAAASEAEAIAQLRPNVDGIVFQYGFNQATFLPQVWESIPDPLDFLMELRLKARVPARFWHADVKLSRYTVDKYR